MIGVRFNQKQRTLLAFIMVCVIILSLNVIIGKKNIKRSIGLNSKLEENVIKDFAKVNESQPNQKALQSNPVQGSPMKPGLIAKKEEKPPEPPAAAPGGFEISEASPFTGGIAWLDSKLCSAIENFVGAASIIDFGAGLGQYGRCFLRSYKDLIVSNEENRKKMEKNFLDRMKTAGLVDKPKVIETWEGYDGATNIEHVTGKWVHFLNLAEPFGLAKRLDWVLSLEVGQNIPQEFENHFLDNLIKHAKKGIILSWAVEGQRGHNHVNNHSNEYVIEKMKEKGLEYDADATKLLRGNVINLYFNDTLMVFRMHS